MKTLARPLLAVVCLISWAACQSSHTQSRIVISDPASDAPPVIQIRSSNGQETVVQGTPENPPQAGASSAVAADSPSAPPATPPPDKAPRAKKVSYNSVATDHPVIAMTFDDGPHPELTPKLLDMLKERGIRATFYVIGRSAEAHPEIVRRMVAEGHEVANHTWTHPALSKISTARQKSEIERTSALLRELTGENPTNMRPPYGATNSTINRRMKDEFGLSVIMWSVDPQDWKYRNASRVSNHILTNTKPGDIVLAHDIHASTIAAMPATLDGLKAKGFQFLTVSQLLAYDGVFRERETVPETTPAATLPEQAPATSIEESTL